MTKTFYHFQKFMVLAGLCFFLGAMPAVGLLAQEAKPGEGFQVTTKEQKVVTNEKLLEFSAKADPVYRMGEGDEFFLEFWGRPELSGKHIVGPDGTITLPLVGSLKVVGLTRDELAQAATTSLSQYYENLLATVKVEKYTSNRVFVLGRVSHPGEILFDVQPTLLETITRAGCLPVGGVGADKAALTRCAVFRGQDQLIWIDLKSLLTEGNLTANIRLQRNDILYIPDSDDQLVYVLGEVNQPGALRLTPDMTFLDALALAGGPSRDSAQSKIQLVRPGTGLNQEIDFKLLLDPKSRLNYSLEEGDIIYVPKRGLAKAGYVFEKLNPFISLLVITRTLTR